MDFRYSEEQTLLRDALTGFLADRYDAETRRRAVTSEAGRDPAIWTALAQELGVLGAPLPEALGGLGGGAIETLVVMEALGKALAGEPFIETVVLAGGLLARSGRADAPALVEKIVGGETIVAFAHGEPQARDEIFDVATTARRNGDGWVLDGHKAVVTAAPWADLLLVSARSDGARRDRDGLSLFLVPKDAAGLLTRDYATVDERRASDVWFEGVRLPADALVGPEGGAAELIERALDEATVAVCGEALGVLRFIHETTVDYARQRRQFGRPIGDFQVLQHRMVDMFMALEQAVSLTLYAALMLDRPAVERAKAVSAAKVKVGQACRFVGQAAIQIHGGMGMTDELPVSRYFKRATLIEGAFGSVEAHLKRFERLSRAPGAEAPAKRNAA
jgi:hypothetical protein